MNAEGDGERDTRRALVFLAVGAALAFCWWARELLIPTALGLVLAASVHPLVTFLERRRLPRPVASAVGALVAVLVLAGIGLLLYDRLSSFMDELPGYQDRLDHLRESLRRHVTRLQVQSEKLVAPPRQPGQVRVQEGVPWAALLVGTASGAAGLIADAAVVVFVLYFALADGPRYRQKLLARAGLARDRTLKALDELQRDVEQYLLNRVMLNAILGVVMTVAYALYGLDHAAIWGITTALLHFVPYVGPAVGFVLPTAMAILQYDGSLARIAGVAAIYLVLVSVQGNLVDPIFLGKQLRLNALAVFLGSLFWFWLWGPVGLFLAVPLLSTIRILCKQLPRFDVVAELLAE
jgi:predicted PurR-regulated permease PerM